MTNDATRLDNECDLVDLEGRDGTVPRVLEGMTSSQSAISDGGRGQLGRKSDERCRDESRGPQAIGRMPRDKLVTPDNSRYQASHKNVSRG
ncbi:hypothetical protein AVEN_17524-1 [Araneus ventricosus]|uniref:Uncharacterized protein n=1 Tax=Araneus ventricosus TaxID=182803 RepID=A0A4Y2LVI2_ARAVE|nr:hypothetical protein AVEN_17524-1 [Araneus ventricosus]